MEPLQLLAETRSTRFEVAYHTDDDRVLGGEVKDPLVVLQPRARLCDDGANDAQRLGESGVGRRQRRAIELAAWIGPGHGRATPGWNGSRWIEEMRVGIDDPVGGRSGPLRSPATRRPGRRATRSTTGVDSTATTWGGTAT